MPLARTSLVAGSSQSAGNTVNTHARLEGMAAPGSEPVDPIPALDSQDDPTIGISADQPEPTTAVRPGPYRARPMTWSTL
jgi:hypothetical protein